MIRRPTIFVIGAGASVAVGYPTGPELADRICTKLKGKQDLFTATQAAGFTPEAVEDFCEHFYASHRTLDTFLSENTDFRAIGKFAIAFELVALENEQGLLEMGRTSWYKKFLYALGSNLEELRLNRVTILTFNYDRSLDQFLYRAFHSQGGRSSPDPNLLPAYLGNLGLRHIHGMLSPLMWSTSRDRRAYAATADPAVIRECAHRLILADEDAVLTLAGQPATEVFQNAEQVFFLGFGFDPRNMRKLGLDSVEAPKPPKYWGSSGFGMSERRKGELTRRYNICFYDDIDSIFGQYEFNYVPGA